MFDPRLDADNEYPVELSAPDIVPYQKGGAGVDYFHIFDSKAAGPNVCITALVHGNELCGAIALDRLLQSRLRPRRGKLSLGFMNVEAFFAFDPANANRSRWLEEDFNRLWGVLDDPARKPTAELRRARAVRPLIAEADLLLDLHSMQTPCSPLLLSGAHQKGRDLADALGMNAAVIADAGHAEGVRMRDYGGFGAAAGGKNALLAECGQNWEKESAEVAFESALRFIRHAGVMDADFGMDFLAGRPGGGARHYRVGVAVTVSSGNFRFAGDWLGLERLPRGTLIGHDGGREIIAPFDPTVLIMPSRRLFPGQTAVRLAYPTDAAVGDGSA